MIYDESQLRDKKCKRINTKCPFCKKIFLCERRLIKRALRENKEKYCSHLCSSLVQKKQKIDIVCTFCQINFERLESDISDSINNYCSHKCRAKHQNKIKEEDKIKNGLASTFTCKECGISKRCLPSLVFIKKFCSIKCRNIFNLKKYEEINIHNNSTVSELFKECPCCYKKFRIYYHCDFKKRIYCSGACRNKINNKYVKGFRSKAEQMLEYELNQEFPNEEILFNDRVVLNGLELDVFFPKLKLAIEWNGIYHYKQVRSDKSFARIQSADIKKQKLCSDQDIILFVVKDLTSNEKFIKSQISNLIKYIKNILI